MSQELEMEFSRQIKAVPGIFMHFLGGHIFQNQSLKVKGFACLTKGKHIFQAGNRETYETRLDQVRAYQSYFCLKHAILKFSSNFSSFCKSTVQY